MKNDQGFEDKDHFLPINFRRYLRGVCIPTYRLIKAEGLKAQPITMAKTPEIAMMGGGEHLLCSPPPIIVF